MEWNEAYARAGEIAASSWHEPDESNWDWVALRGLIAVTLYAAAREGSPAVAAPVSTGRLLWHLDQGPEHVRTLMEPLVGEKAAHATDTDPADVDANDPVAAQWLWLTRTWPARDGEDVTDPADGTSGTRRWNGMTRAMGATDAAAVDVCTSRAVEAVSKALETERPGHPGGTRVKILGGADPGQYAEVLRAVWLLNDSTRDVSPGAAPPGYEVRLLRPDEKGPASCAPQFVEAGHVHPVTVESDPAAYVRLAYESVFAACHAWAWRLAGWHQQADPEAWLGQPTDGRWPVRLTPEQSAWVPLIIAVALHRAAHDSQLDTPADGSALRHVLLPHILGALPAADDASSAAFRRGLDPALGPTQPVSLALAALRELWNPTSEDHHAVRDRLLGLARAVVTRHAEAPGPAAETTLTDRLPDLLQPPPRTRVRLSTLVGAQSAPTGLGAQIDAIRRYLTVDRVWVPTPEEEELGAVLLHAQQRARTLQVDGMPASPDPHVVPPLTVHLARTVATATETESVLRDQWQDRLADSPMRALVEAYCAAGREVQPHAERLLAAWRTAPPARPAADSPFPMDREWAAAIRSWEEDRLPQAERQPIYDLDATMHQAISVTYAAVTGEPG